MADEDKKQESTGANVISDKDRFKYIGFEVFPGKPKDLFKSEAEREKLVERVIQRRQAGRIREDCTLLEKRVSGSDRIVLTLACIVILASLFVPWYGVYNEVELTGGEPAAGIADTSMLAAVEDTLADSLWADSLELEPVRPDLEEVLDDPAGDEAPVEPEPGEPVTDEGMELTTEERGPSEEVLHGYVARKKIYKEHSRVSAIGAFVAIGSLASHVFSSGVVLMFTGALFIVYMLLCIGLPAYTLVGLYAGKMSEDDRALRLKKVLRYNWLPLVIFVVCFFVSFLGADYGFDAAALYSSLGDSYGIGAFFVTLNWGVYVSLAAFILVAVKGAEI